MRGLSTLFGSPLYDEETGELLGRAFVVVWRGRIKLLGYTGSLPPRPVCVKRRKLAYWCLSIGFTAPREPDFPRIR